MRDQIIKNHPGINNASDPSFKDDLKKAYSKAKNASTSMSVSNPDQIKTVISAFAKSFNDTHLWVSWKDTAQNTSRKLQSQNFTIEHVNPKVVWITLPTFDLKSNQKKDFEHILQQLPNLKNKDVIVFDLRCNQGGNSEYGDQIIDHLFGSNYAKQQRHIANKNISVDWRASPGNLSHVRELHARYKSEWMKNVADGIEESIKLHKPYYHEMAENTAELKQTASTHDITAKIIVIIDSLNVSAALDFIDSLKTMNHPLTLIGKKTKADRHYMEVRSVDLPSGLGTFSYPIKVYRNRPRGDNVPYVPDIECNVTDAQKLLEYVKEIK